MSAAQHFAQSYVEARDKFLAASSAAGLEVQSHEHPLPGRDGEVLAMDVARFGAADAQAMLVLSSACHGVEGYCGSGVQHALLADVAWHGQVQEAGVAVLYIHGLNPHGFSWWRRTTHENVDLNRNFQDFGKALPANDGYERIAAALVPAVWPPTAENEAVLAAFATEHGPRGLQAAVTGGQYRHADGLFFGGTAPTWSQQTLRRVLQQHGRRCARLGWIDVHTGLGPNGHGEIIFAGHNDAAAVARARQWWGAQVTSIYDGSSSSALLSGLMCNAAYEECPQAQYTGMALEFGTVPVHELINALRADQWLQNHPQAGLAQHRAIKRQVRDAFYTDTDAWKASIVEQGLSTSRQALRGLSARS